MPIIRRSINQTWTMQFGVQAITSGPGIMLWKGDWGAAVVWYGAAAEIRVVSVTSLPAWAVTISANVNKLAASVGYDLVAPKQWRI